MLPAKQNQSIPSNPSSANLSTQPGFKWANATDLVGVFDSSFNQVFDLARPLKLSVNTQSKLMDHPIEDGSTITDFRIIPPIELELSLVCTSRDYISVYQQIKTLYSSGALLIVFSKVETYLNMMIQAMPHEETPDMFDVIPVALKMREVQIVRTQYQPLTAKKVRKAKDQSTVKTGDTVPQQQSVAKSIVGYFH